MKKTLFISFLYLCILTVAVASTGKTKTYCGSIVSDEIFGRVMMTLSEPLSGFSSFEVLATTNQSTLALKHIKDNKGIVFEACVQSKERPQMGVEGAWLPITYLKFE